MAAEPTHINSSDTVLVVTGGAAPGLAERRELPAPIAVVAADSGVLRARDLGLRVTLAVGDFDSVTPADLDAVEADGGLIERHPRAKEETDVALALRCALRFAPRRVVVVGGQGGRLDHLLAGVAVLSSSWLAGVEVEARMGNATLTVIRPGAQRAVRLCGSPGELVSLLPAHGPAHGVVTSGLVYPLHAETLDAGSTRGVSNEFVATTATVALREGALVAVQPGAEEPHVPTRSDYPPRQPGAPT